MPKNNLIFLDFSQGSESSGVNASSDIQFRVTIGRNDASIYAWVNAFDSLPINAGRQSAITRQTESLVGGVYFQSDSICLSFQIQSYWPRSMTQ